MRREGASSQSSKDTYSSLLERGEGGREGGRRVRRGQVFLFIGKREGGRERGKEGRREGGKDGGRTRNAL